MPWLDSEASESRQVEAEAVVRRPWSQGQDDGCSALCLCRSSPRWWSGPERNDHSDMSWGGLGRGQEACRGRLCMGPKVEMVDGSFA